MGTDASVYNFPHRLELALKQLETNEGISDNNRKIILQFKEECVAQGLSTSRIIRYIQILSKLSTYLGKDFESATKDDMVKVLTKIENVRALRTIW